MRAQNIYAPYEYVSYISHGSYGYVQKVLHSKQEKFYAMKVIKLDKKTTQDQLNKTKQEGQILDRYRHPNIISYIDTLVVEEGKNINVCIIMEYVEGNTLKELIQLQDSKKFEIIQINKFIVQMVEALDYLHKQDVAHRDLKPDNIIVQENGWLKLLDFGQAKENQLSQMSYRTGRLGTLPYNAPEQFDPMLDGKGNATYKADCWSLGIIIYELVSLKLPFTEQNERELERIIKLQIFEPLDGPEYLRELVESLLSRNPDERITYSQIKERPFLKEYFKAYENGTLLEFQPSEGLKQILGQPQNRQIDEYIIQLENALKQVEEQKNQIVQYKLKISEEKEQIQKLTDDYNLKVGENKTLEENLERLRIQENENLQENRKLKDQIALLEGRISDLENQIIVLKQERQTFQPQSNEKQDQLQKTIDEQKTTISQKNDEISNLQQEVKDLKEKLKQVEEKQSSMQIKLESQTEQIIKLLSDQIEKTNQINQLMTEIKQLKTEITESKNIISDQQQQIDKTSSDKDIIEKERDQLIEDKKKSTEEMKILKEAKNQLEKAKKQVEQENEQNKTQLEQLKEERKQYEELIEHYQEQLKINEKETKSREESRTPEQFAQSISDQFEQDLNSRNITWESDFNQCHQLYKQVYYQHRDFFNQAAQKGKLHLIKPVVCNQNGRKLECRQGMTCGQCGKAALHQADVYQWLGQGQKINNGQAFNQGFGFDQRFNSMLGQGQMLNSMMGQDQMFNSMMAQNQRLTQNLGQVQRNQFLGQNQRLNSMFGQGQEQEFSYCAQCYIKLV